MKRFVFVAVLLVGLSGMMARSQGYKQVDDLERPGADWEAGFQNRLEQMWGERVPLYKINPGDGGPDSGKQQWSRFLAQMSFAKEGTDFSSFIETGRKMINGTNVGSFYKPFSCAGYAMYFFHWRDSIMKYDPEQIELVHADVDAMWHYLLRTDHLLDACCGYNEAGGKEFNSENFQWMLKCAGYLFSHELHQKEINGYVCDMTSKDLEKITVRTGNEQPAVVDINPRGVNVMRYFDESLKNLTRALYNAGRLEWNSNNYFGHTLNPLQTIYECADKCNDPNSLQNKKRAQACLDWMMVEAAVRYRDGMQVAADARAKNSAFLPFKGSYFPYTIPYFSDNEHYPSFGDTVWKDKNPGESEVGFLTTSAYRPPQIVVDIAQLKFDLPVEIQSAKPFYHIDNGKFFNADGTVNGEAAYADWNGENRGRRFEFETIYIGRKFTMASAAVGRPDGAEGTFSEQSMWRLGVEGQKAGALAFSGNAGDRETTTGRYVWHEIGQYRNMMMQLVKSPSDNKIWIAVPDPSKELRTSGEATFGEAQEYRWKGNNLYLNMGHDVYLLVKPSASATVSVNHDYSESAVHSQLTFEWNANALGALVIEVGEKDEYQNFDQFISKTQDKAVVVTENLTAQYESGLGNVIKMEFVEPGTFTMVDYTFDTPAVNPLPVAGSYPKVWGDETFIDFASWDSYRTVFGHPVVTQKWGSGEMVLRANDKVAKISVDPVTAEVTYYECKESEYNYSPVIADDFSVTVSQESADGMVCVKSVQEQLQDIFLYGVRGDMLCTKKLGNVKEATVSLADYSSGMYLMKVVLSDGRNKVFRVLHR